MTAIAGNLLVVRFVSAASSCVEATLLGHDEKAPPEVFRIPAIGAYRISRRPEARQAWLVGHEAGKISSGSTAWNRVSLIDDPCPEKQLQAWQLMAGLFLEVERSIRTRVDRMDRRIDIVAVGKAVCSGDGPQSPPGWLRLVLERLGWTGQVVACEALPSGATAIFATERGTLPARDRYAALVERLAQTSAAWVPFGQRRIEYSLQFVKTLSSGHIYTQWIVGTGETLPAQSEIRLVLDDADIAARQLAFFWYPADSDGRFKICLRTTPDSDRRPFATVPADQLAASDPNGGVRMILEIDRFGRCYMTLRDEFDRLIAIETKQPSSSDGPAWNISAPANGTPLRPADRIYLGNLFFGDVAGVSWEEWERLPGALAQTSFNGQPCEAYHHDRRSRQRQGAVLSYAKEDVRRTLDLHIQRWRESGNEFLYERIVGSNIDSSNRDSLHLAAVDALFRDLPQDMHHFQALLRSLPQALSGGGRRDE